MQGPLLQNVTLKRAFCDKNTKINNNLKVRDIIFLPAIARLFRNIGLKRTVAKCFYFPKYIFHISFGKDNLTKNSL